MRHSKIKVAILSTIGVLASVGAGYASGPGETAEGETSYVANGVMNYALFEQAVLHSDLETCPAEFDPEVVFCRITLVNDMANIWVFGLEGEQQLLAVKPYPLNGDFVPF